MEIGTAGVGVGWLGLIVWCIAVTTPAPASQDSDAMDWARCSAKCNKGLVDCWDKHPGDPGGKCDEQWTDCNVKCRPKTHN